LGCSCSTVSRTLDRWEQYGEAGLIDRREDNGQAGEERGVKKGGHKPSTATVCLQPFLGDLDFGGRPMGRKELSVPSARAVRCDQRSSP
jgi:hypothetical protein